MSFYLWMIVVWSVVLMGLSSFFIFSNPDTFEDRDGTSFGALFVFGLVSILLSAIWIVSVPGLIAIGIGYLFARRFKKN